ncbi:MAG: cyclic nucleotide-binding domain-containing protein [Ignavibacteria bacterium]|nr:cyclic nucleotide-binding domain-containing protein [Ignavibacteria bacterium]MBT8381324.1 cyclic nucleotide-binding domain-containing protein [Ignavibacteria bacterium]MBT8391693.1 cyclic nucleotide-binding domain-containing protein [Ignavibacteria bacterium]NNJ54235.1 cyclic nucleotide-binding domain-containing protein [Ignavibacteriaceae bacterium]NNL22752.1 cyclic nucleotide-binding domain-containing protein [Ignavibacteriaceae bacterium]
MMDENKKTVHSSFWSNIFNPPTETTELSASLKAIPLFKDLGKRDLSNLIGIIHDRNYLAGEYIFYQGDPGIGLYLIREGEVSVNRTNDAGSEIVLATFSKGDFLGELALVDGEKRSASAVAKTDTRLSVIFKPDLDEFIEKYPKKGIKILQGIAEIAAVRLRTLNEDYFSLKINKK